MSFELKLEQRIKLIEGSRVGISAKSDKKQQMLEGEDE
jgi:hypothetical protein